MKKILLIITIILSSFIITGCSSELEKIEYAYPDSKDVIVTLEQYNKLKTGMSENEVWEIFGGKCTNTGTTDLGLGEEYITVSYGCNGNGGIGSNIILMFQGGILSTMSQIDLK